MTRAKRYQVIGGETMHISQYSLQLSKRKDYANMSLQESAKLSSKRKSSPHSSSRHKTMVRQSSKHSHNASFDVRNKSIRRSSAQVCLHQSLIAIEKDTLPVELPVVCPEDSREVVKGDNHRDDVASWAVAFDNLLHNQRGKEVFSTFLRQEFSEENIAFWSDCEQYKRIPDSDSARQQSEARRIFDKYLDMHALEPVNIDSATRREVEVLLTNPNSRTFDSAQRHIYNLMKQDSYRRFLKSELYQSCLMGELDASTTSASSASKKGETTDGKKDKRRRSLLSWKQKSSKALCDVDSDKLKKLSRDSRRISSSAIFSTDFCTLDHEPQGVTKETKRRLSSIFGLLWPAEKRRRGSVGQDMREEIFC